MGVLRLGAEVDYKSVVRWGFVFRNVSVGDKVHCLCPFGVGTIDSVAETAEF